MLAMVDSRIRSGRVAILKRQQLGCHSGTGRPPRAKGSRITDDQDPAHIDDHYQLPGDHLNEAAEFRARMERSAFIVRTVGSAALGAAALALFLIAVATIRLYVLVGGLMLLACSGKAFGFAPAQVVAMLNDAGLGGYIQVIGVGGLVSAILLTRKLGEQVVVPQCGLSVTVVAVQGGGVRLTFDAPSELGIYRKEVWERICSDCAPRTIPPGIRRDA
jgi:carbon storage regulator